MEELGRALHAAGMTVSIPRLPGHGTDGSDFLQTGWRDWLRACTDEMLELCARHRPVSLVGFSMGSLLALILAARFPVARLALLAPPIRSRDPRLPFTPLLALFFRRRPTAAPGAPSRGPRGCPSRAGIQGLPLPPAAGRHPAPRLDGAPEPSPRDSSHAHDRGPAGRVRRPLHHWLDRGEDPGPGQKAPLHRGRPPLAARGQRPRDRAG